MAHGGKQRGANPVSSDIRETDDHLSIGEGYPVKVVAPGVIGRLVPTGNIEPRNVGAFLGQQRLLNGARYL
jgi:hypothetical protein